MTELAAVVLAHADPIQLRRLIGALDEIPIFLHCDAKTDVRVFNRMTADLPRNVTVLPRIRTSLASWSLVEAELAGVRQALATTSARHIAVLSGADYPLQTMHDMVTELRAWEGRSYFHNVPMPYPRWDIPRHRDGGMWRVRRRYVTRGHQVVYVGDYPLRWPIPRSVPKELELRAASHWKFYARHHAQAVLTTLDQRKDLARFWRSTLLPEESCVASILGSRMLLGSDAVPPCYLQPWYLDWPVQGMHHPRWLGMANADTLIAAREAESVTPADANTDVEGRDWMAGKKLFARKFSTNFDTKVLDIIDSSLRG